MEQSVTFDFDFYRFTGKGERPTLVPTPHQAHFTRSATRWISSWLTLPPGR